MNPGKSNVSNRKGSAWLPAEKAKIHEMSLKDEQVTGLFEIPKDVVNYSGLMEGETIESGFVLIRDAVLFTNYRIIYADKQGAAGQKTRINTIYLGSVINVSMETAGFGIDDSEINIEFIISPYYKVSAGASTSEIKLEFPKRCEIQGLYRWLEGIAFANHNRINQ